MKMGEIELVSCPALHLIVPYFDKELVEYIAGKHGDASNIKLVEYSSLTSLR